MNFAKYNRIVIPEGSVKQITRKSDGLLLWEERIPSIYQEVEWIGTDGKSYFVSNFTINNLDKFTLYYRCSSPQGDNYMFGASNATTQSENGVTAPRFLHRYTGMVINPTKTSGASFGLVITHDNSFHDIEMKCVHEGEILFSEDGGDILKTTFYNAKVFEPFGVFCNNYNKNPRSYMATSGSKIAELRFVDDTTNEDVFNPIPCYRKSDGVIGMYDIVSQTFFTNAGTGTFTKGADV